MSGFVRLVVLVIISVGSIDALRGSWTSSEPPYRHAFNYRRDFDDSVSRRDFWPEHQYRRPKPLMPTPPHRNGNRIPPMGRNHPPPMWSPGSKPYHPPPTRPPHPPVVPPTRHRSNNKLMSGYWDARDPVRIPSSNRVVQRVPGGSHRSPLKLNDDIDIHINILDHVTPNPPTVKPKPLPMPVTIPTTKKPITTNPPVEEKSVVIYTEELVPEATVDNSVAPSANYVIRKSDYHPAPAPAAYPVSIDFSSLFVALIPIALFLGATSALALAVATKPNQAVATAQQQQQQQEGNNNNNDNNSNNNLMSSLLASYFASTTTNNNNYPNNYYNNYPYIVVINNTAFTVGRSNDEWQINLRKPFHLFDKLKD